VGQRFDTYFDRRWTAAEAASETSRFVLIGEDLDQPRLQQALVAALANAPVQA